MKKAATLAVVAVVTFVLLAGCTLKFAGKTQPTPGMRFITGNEPIEKDKYDVVGVVVAEKQHMFFDILGLVTPANTALGDAFTGDIAEDLSNKAKEIGGNALTNVEIIQWSYAPGCTFIGLLPIGMAYVTAQATAVRLK